MDCRTVRRKLREQFDAGLRLGEGIETHVAECAACAHYCEKLRGLVELLVDLPLEEPSRGFLGRVQAAVAREGRRAALLWRPAAMGLAAAFVAALILGGWFVPIKVDPEKWLFETKEVVGALEPRDWRAIGPGLLAEVETLWQDTRTVLVAEGLAMWRQLNSHWGISPIVLWSSLGALLGVMIGVNGVEARRLYSATSSRAHGRTHYGT